MALSAFDYKNVEAGIYKCFTYPRLRVGGCLYFAHLFYFFVKLAV